MAALVMCLLFVVVDIGNPLAAWHLMPGHRLLNWPRSLLAWDVIVLNGYLALNLAIPFYILYSHFTGRQPDEEIPPVDVHRRDVGGEHPPGDRIPAGRSAGPALLEHRAAGPALSRIRVHRGARVRDPAALVIQRETDTRSRGRDSEARR